MAKNGLGPITVLGITVNPGPMDPAAAQGITEDEYLERLYAQAPKMLAIAEKLGPILARIGGKK
jgi:hypothetical protein